MAKRPTLLVYVLRRLGPGNALAIVRNVFVRPFTSSTLRAFWLHWNPVFGYYLAYFCYRPLRRIVSPPLAVLFTFAVSGFLLHDLLLWPAALAKHEPLPYPAVTVAFLVSGGMVLVAEVQGIEFSRLPAPVRCLVHIACLAVSFGISFGLRSTLYETWP